MLRRSVTPPTQPPADPARRPTAPTARLRRARLTLTRGGSAYLAEQITRRYRDDMDTQRLPVVRRS